MQCFIVLNMLLSKGKIVLIILVAFTQIFSACSKSNRNFQNDMPKILYTFPEESELHEGTWLQWPHHYQYGQSFRETMDPIWVELTKELVDSENVHIIAYDELEKNRILDLLKESEIDTSNVDFKLYPTDDFWIRDNGPIYVYDQSENLVIQDWGFNGWGNKVDFKNCNNVPKRIGEDQEREVIDLNSTMINEGGSVELDGYGTLMACRSSILNSNRNPGMTQKEAERIFTEYLGATHFIWLDGQPGLEITDQHIDGFARFGNTTTIVTMSPSDLLEYDVKQSDIDKLYAATDIDGNAYTLVVLPLTSKNVVTSAGKQLDYKGSYCNYYIANTKVLVPIYNDSNDKIAMDIIQDLYPDRMVVGIDFSDVYEYGGMIHCVTQQQPQE